MCRSMGTRCGSGRSGNEANDGALMKRNWIWISLAAVVWCGPALAEATIGPPKGALVIVGGGGGGKDGVVFKRFVELAGGSDAEFVVIPTASESEDFDSKTSGAKVLRSAGA